MQNQIRELIEIHRFPLVIAICALLLVTAFYLEHKQSEEWEEFKVANECRIVAKREGEVHTQIGPSINANGNLQTTVLVGSSSSQVGWECNDGITYWKNEL